MRTTKKHFLIFRTECEKWIDMFGLKDWETTYVHEPIKDLAKCTTSILARDLVFYFTTNWPKDEPFSEEIIRRTAFHEVVEGGLLGRLRILAKLRWVKEEEIDEEGHTVTRILENVLWKSTQ